MSVHEEKDGMAERELPRTPEECKAVDDVSLEALPPLPEGSLILGGRYRLLQVLHQRPRINLYLAQRLPQSATGTRSVQTQGQLVAIRELTLDGLQPDVRAQVEQAAFEEFVSPAMLGSPRLPGAGDRVRSVGDRHYLVMQLRGTGGERRAVAITLADLLMQKQWPHWLTPDLALDWSIQLCRIVARLHRLGVVLGDLAPDTILVDREAAVSWAPVLLVSWPPAPYFWALSSDGVSVEERYATLFPFAAQTSLYDLPFAAPEMLSGTCDELADVYSLGAILYLLTTRYAPIAALRRLRLEFETLPVAQADDPFLPLPLTDGVELIPPDRLNPQVYSPLSTVILQAMELNPLLRFPTVFALIEALEQIQRRKNREREQATFAGKIRVGAGERTSPAAILRRRRE